MFFDQRIYLKQFVVEEGIEVFKLVKFGSAMLGGDDPDSDIDILLTSYKNVLNRLQFFDELMPFLQ